MSENILTFFIIYVSFCVYWTMIVWMFNTNQEIAHQKSLEEPDPAIEKERFHQNYSDKTKDWHYVEMIRLHNNYTNKKPWF